MRFYSKSVTRSTLTELWPILGLRPAKGSDIRLGIFEFDVLACCTVARFPVCDRAEQGLKLGSQEEMWT